MIVVPGDGLLDCGRRLLAGEIDAISTDAILLHGYARDEPGFRIEEGVTFGAVQQYGIGMSPEDGTASCELLSRYLREFMDSGAWDVAFRTNFGDSLRPEDFRPRQLKPCLADPDPERAGG